MIQSALPLKLQVTATTQGQLVLDLLSEASGLSKSRIKDAMNKGAVWWTRKGKTLRLRRATQRLDKGTSIQLFYDPQVLARTPETPQLIADLRSYSVWYKPHGLLAQGSQWGDHCCLLRWAELHMQPRRATYLVHRLDAEAAGLMLVAHNADSAARFSALFQEHRMTKIYQARVQGLMPFTGTLTLAQALDGKSATTHVNMIHQDPHRQQTLLQVRIETGRKHQIRRHLAAHGFPIVGDRLYGTASDTPLQLIACRLGFVCPLSRQERDYQLPSELCLQP